MILAGKFAGVAVLAGLLTTGLAGTAVAAQAHHQVTAASAKPAATIRPADDDDVTEAQWISDVSTALAPADAYVEGRTASPSGQKLAMVFDIDNTALETYFHPFDEPATGPVLDLANYAHDHGVSLFFVTARPDFISSVSEYSLTSAGYTVNGVYGRDIGDLFEPVQEFKTDQRINIEKHGYTIIANIGNSATDLEGGHAERTFKLPDYNGLLD
jgi:hypothetical protein